MRTENCVFFQIDAIAGGVQRGPKMERYKLDEVEKLKKKTTHCGLISNFSAGKAGGRRVVSAAGRESTRLHHRCGRLAAQEDQEHIDPQKSSQNFNLKNISKNPFSI